MNRNYTLLGQLVSVLKAVSVIALVIAVVLIIVGFANDYGDYGPICIISALGLACTVSIPFFVIAELIRVFLQMERNTWDTRNFLEELALKQREPEKKTEPKQPVAGRTINEMYR